MTKFCYIILALFITVVVVLLLAQSPADTCKRSCAVSTDPDHCVSLCVGD